MNIIEFKGAEAVSLDGTHWDIYVRNHELIEDIHTPCRILTSDIRYGSWSKEKGLKRGAIYPSDDFKRMEEQGAQLYEYLLEHHHQVPFPFLDNYELWLLDKKGKPLALIDSSLREQDIDQQPFLDWRAGQLCHGEFKSSAYEDIKKQWNCDMSAGKYLTHYINQLSGNPPRAQWFKRTIDGHGIGLNGHNIPEQYISRELDESLFNSFMISDSQHDNLHINLINEFIHWQSPWLLLLDTLSESQRLLFEDFSRKRALIVDQLHRLYPEVMDLSLINAARVEAKLRKSNLRQDDNRDNDSSMCTEYIELSPSPYE